MSYMWKDHIDSLPGVTVIKFEIGRSDVYVHVKYKGKDFRFLESITLKQNADAALQRIYSTMRNMTENRSYG